jgi:hypothetical protein
MMHPFPPDSIALMRADFCMAPENVSASQDVLECTLSAKQCGSYVAATRDPRLAATAVEPLSRTVAPLTITGWSGGQSEQLMEGEGACQTLAADVRYRQPLWDSMGFPSVRRSYEGVSQAQAREPISPARRGDRYRLVEAAYGSPEWFLDRYLRETQVPKSLR